MSASQDDVENEPEAVGTYQMRPKMEEEFKEEQILIIIEKVITEKLQGKVYNAQEAKIWSKSIADEVNEAVRDLKLKRYKHIVQVCLGQQLGSGCRYLARFRWDAEADNYVSGKYTNASLFCVCTVFGIYMY